MPVASLPLDNSRTLPRLGGARAKLNATTQSSARSPDGYFSPSEDFRQMFRNPFINGGPIESTTIGRRNSHQIMPDLQDVQEDENTDPAHRWIRPTRFDSRSPCPALNTAANHGYLPRDGRQLTMWAIIKALRECYNVSWVLATLFTVGSFVILRLGGVGEGWINPRIDLEDLAAHNILEHNASMTHLDLEEEIARKNEQRNGSRSPKSPRSRSSSGSSTSSTTVERPSTPSFFPLTPSRVFEIAHWLFSFSISIVLSFLPNVAGAKASAETSGHMSPGGSLYGSANANASAGLLFQHLSIHTSPSKHRRTPRHGHPCAPIRPHRPLIEALFADSASGTHLTLKDVARARIRRQQESQGRATKTPVYLEQFADSEFCLTLALFSENDNELKADISDLRQWLEDERLPTGWRPRREVGFWQNHLNTARLQEIVKGYRKYRSRGREVRTVAFD